MCILCVVQKWSRRVATMLPWLVIPLIGLWALSQLLPPGFRFEVTSPRLACVIVLLVTLFWYEILMPQLSIWRTKRIARLRERKRFEAIEMQKLRKMATRRCRNCSTPYRDQNPGGGKFMCSYCGHVSKRPVLDIPGGSAGLGITNSGIIGDLVSKGGKILSDNTWICGHEWRENGGNWVSGSFAVKSSSSSSSHHWGKSRVGFFGNDDHCLTEKSYSGVFVSACKLVGSFFLCVKWLWRKIFRGNSSAEDDDTLDSDHNGMLSKKGENGVNFHETRVEKARRKAEERRQARLERELLEEEERKQREEVARLVEERRKLRDETIEAEKEHHDKSSVTQQNKDSSKRDAERKRSERRKEKEKDKGSSKSNSDVEDLDRKAAVKESEKKREYDRRNDNIERRLPKTTALDTVRHHSSTNSSSRGTGGRYLDRVKGSLLSSSKAFNGAILFGKSTQTSGNVVHKTTNPNGSADHVQASSTRREAVLELPPKNVPRSWGQLFTRAPAVPVTSYANAISQPNQLPQPVARGKQLPSQASPKNHFDNQIHFGGLSAPLNLPPIPNVSTSHTSVLHSVGPPQDFLPEEQEFFGDPCYVPDPVSLLGPVSESLDNFPLDLGTGFLTDKEFGKPYSLKNVSVSAEVTRPSPIESPMSRLRVVEERHNNISCQSQSTPKSQDFNSSPLKESSKAHEPGTWQMWSSPPLVQDGLGLVGGPASWLLPIGQNKSLPGEVIHPSLHKDMMSQHAKENQVLPGTCSPQRVSIGNSQIGGAFNPLGPGLMENDPWLQKNVFNQSLSNGENNFPPLIPGEDYARNEKTTYGSPARSTTRDQYELSPANCWSNGRDEAVHGSGEGVGNSTLARPPGGLFSTPDVQSLWSFN